jgi:methyltransferase (TIGR00027 family)
MNESQVSITALVCAFTRAYHAENDTPKIFDDFVASTLFTPEEKAFFRKSVASLLSNYDPQAAVAHPDEEDALRIVMQVYNSSTILSRARFTEDCLDKTVEQGTTQYMVLGAGFDTFALRHPDLADRLQVFEVDHPATQANKRERILRINPTLPANLHLIPVDFSKDDLEVSLLNAGYNPAIPGFMSWLGVTYYLEQPAIHATLLKLSHLSAPGSTLVFDYANISAFQPGGPTDRERTTRSITRQAGEPMKTGFDPAELESTLGQFGFSTIENLTPEEIDARYFSNRHDLYHAFNHVHFIRAVRT